MNMLVRSERTRFQQASDAARTDHRPGRGRQSDGEITCFMNNIGLGYQFAAAARWSIARLGGRAGHELPTEWFTEDVHPESNDKGLQDRG